MKNPFAAVPPPCPDPKETLLASVPETERWDPVPGSTGHQVPVPASEDEDDEGRSTNEQMVEGGVAAAEDEQAAQAIRAAAKKDL